jgi:tRNA (guanine37-N1)-methyltransferase
VQLYKLNDYAKDTSGHVDDKAYGMHGQVLSPLPLSRAIEDIQGSVGNAGMRSEKIPVFFFSPQGKILEQQDSEEFSQNLEECVIICGHYEGIDQRIIDIYVDHEISLGNFILTG